ncbi:hypothetical protein K402DRAFT_464638 [Aulographum hederae CBS 113979]|uniref:SnoaL-like domain-containing protein n=1 Tax=Aulographum hederae CBS 113979 TaxID=1176131 RepID=A0A6G1GWJ8_9PEZI|nr:hypothetical protein K402DRAFT_464638 [Aulographum hederae CBS 113979]
MESPNPMDHFAIRNTISRYCIALDTKDWELLKQVFTPDVIANYPFRDEMDSLEAVSQAIQGRLGEVITQHALTTQVIVVAADGKTATGETYFTGAHFGHGKYEGTVLQAFGKYLDDLVCVGEGSGGYRDWRIKKRTVKFMKRIGDERIMDH